MAGDGKGRFGGGRSSDRVIVGVVLGVQLAASLGFFAVMSHVVVHLRHDLGLLAGTVGLVLGLRIGLQYALYLPAGVLTDRVGAARTGALACVLRAAGFALLGSASGLPTLLGAAVLLATGGALFHPAAQSLLAGVTARRRAFAGYVATGQAAAVAGPPLGLLVTFSHLALGAAVLWTTAALLFLALRGPTTTASGTAGRGHLRPALRDRAFLRLALVLSPTTLLIEQMATAVPMLGSGRAAVTVYLCVLATVAAMIQPFIARRADRPAILRASMLATASAFALLLVANPLAFLAAACLAGIATGAMQPAVFHSIVRHAPARAVGVHLGLAAFASGALAFTGNLLLGHAFEADAAPAALLALAALALTSAATHRTAPAPRVDSPPLTTPPRPAPARTTQ